MLQGPLPRRLLMRASRGAMHQGSVPTCGIVHQHVRNLVIGQPLRRPVSRIGARGEPVAKQYTYGCAAFGLPTVKAAAFWLNKFLVGWTVLLFERMRSMGSHLRSRACRCGRGHSTFQFSVTERRPSATPGQQTMRGLGSFAVLLVALAAATADATQASGVCNLACIQGTTCQIVNGVAKCVPVEPECTKKCPKNEKCQINSADNSQCCINPCATIRCRSGYTCQVEQVQCIRAPCPPVGTCKPVKKGYGLRALNEDE